jgi:DNA-binding MarR family transcriptional regulator
MAEDAHRPSKRERYAQATEDRIEAAQAMLSDRLGLLWRIHALSYVMSRRPRNDPALHSGISLVAWRVLAALAHCPDLSGNEITRLWGLEKMGVNRAVNDLMKRGLVESQTDPDGGHRRPLRLTVAGHDLYAAIWPGARQDYDLLAAALTPEQLAEFNAAADRLLRRAREITD